MKSAILIFALLFSSIGCSSVQPTNFDVRRIENSTNVENVTIGQVNRELDRQYRIGVVQGSFGTAILILIFIAIVAL